MKEEIKWRERDEHGERGWHLTRTFFLFARWWNFSYEIQKLSTYHPLLKLSSRQTHKKKNNEYERSESIKAENGFWGFMQACNMLKEKTFTRQNAARCFLMCSLMDFLLLTVSEENSSLLMCVEIFSRELSERKTSNDGVYAWSEIWSENYDEIFGLFYWDYDSFWELWGFYLIWRNLFNFQGVNDLF